MKIVRSSPETHKLKLTCTTRALNVNKRIRHAYPYRQNELIKQIFIFPANSTHLFMA